MNIASDNVIPTLAEAVAISAAPAIIRQALGRALRQLEASTEPMAWEIIPLTAFEGLVPMSVHSCWVFVVRGGIATGAERHPNSHQRSLSLTGRGRFELYEQDVWTPYPLVSPDTGVAGARWVTIPPLTWHRLFSGPDHWGMLSFHTVPAQELIEERPIDPAHLTGATRQERYADRE